MSDRGLDRRRFLHGLGVAAALGTAGCSGVTLGTENEPTIDAGKLQALTAEPAPSIPERIPVDIEAAYLDELDADVRETLETVPTPLTATHVPNGAIREDLTHLREHVETDLEAARNAASPYESVETYGRATSAATEVATAWAVIDEGVTRADVTDRVSAIDQARARFRRRWAYVGDDPVVATVVHAALETRVRTATRILADEPSGRPHPPENALTIGELAGRLEEARFAIETADYLDQRYTDSLDDETALHGRFDAAADTLATAVSDRTRQLPDFDPENPDALVDREISGTLAAEVLESLYREIDPESNFVADQLDDGYPANAVLSAVWTLAKLRAFESVRNRVADGESFTIESVADVRSRRAAAVDALREPPDGLESLVLANQVRSQLAHDLRFADRRLSDHDGSVRPSFVHYEVGTYIEIDAITQALPASVAQAVDALRAGA